MRARWGARATEGVLLASLAGAMLTLPSRAQAEILYARDGTFDSQTVIELARNLSRAHFSPPKSPLPESLAHLDYDQYRDIRFRPADAIWARQGLPFRLQLLHRGWLFTEPVEIALVSRGLAHHIAYRPELFTTGSLMTAMLPAEDIGFSGLRILFPINRPATFDEVAVLQGASYFRAVGRGQVYGLSARGLALKTADPAGEEFPIFRAFWVEEPKRTSSALVMHGLLDSPSTTGAFRFTIRPGSVTIIEVEAVLFPRSDLDRVGLATGTSMFLFGPDDRVRVDDFRSEVHDSDGLLMINGQGEHLWRPLANPVELQVSAFQDHSPRGFGLIQRDRNIADYQDLEAHYERRPSLWVEPAGDWGDGAVILTEIPSDSEIHDNIVAFWRPKTPIPAGQEFRCSYRLIWGEGPSTQYARARILATRVGRADVRAPTPVRRFIVDYSRVPGQMDTSPPEATVTTSVGEAKDVVVANNPITGGYRLSFVWNPKQAKLVELRAQLHFKNGGSAETWVYRWTKP